MPGLRPGAGPGLVVELHGYGGDEHQVAALVPLVTTATHFAPRAPLTIDPGFGWWDLDVAGPAVELAPREGVVAAVDAVAAAVRRLQGDRSIAPSETVVIGYSQGATLALSLVARHPDVMAGVVAAAGFLLEDEPVAPVRTPVEVLLLNGTLDPFVTREQHVESLARLTAAGHVTSDRRDPLPHVIDQAQVAVIEASVVRMLGSSPGADGC